MENILLLAHTEADGSLGKAALEALATALALGGELTVGLVGASTQPAAEPDRRLRVRHDSWPSRATPSDSRATARMRRRRKRFAARRGATLVIAAGTSRWARALPGVALPAGRTGGHARHRLDERNGVPAVTRWFYRQRMEAVLTRAQRPWIVLLDTGCVAPWTGAAGTAVVEAVTAGAATRTTVSGYRAPQTDEQTIRPDAKLLFVAGAGWTKKQGDGAVHAAEAEQLILGFLRKTQASLGGSKSLVDLSGEGEAVLRFMTHMNQIGQTGSTPRHAEGAIHLLPRRRAARRWAGASSSSGARSTWTPNCGWARGKADVLYVADAFEVMRRVNELL